MQHRRLPTFPIASKPKKNAETRLTPRIVASGGPSGAGPRVLLSLRLLGGICALGLVRAGDGAGADEEEEDEAVAAAAAAAFEAPLPVDPAVPAMAVELARRPTGGGPIKTFPPATAVPVLVLGACTLPAPPTAAAAAAVLALLPNAEEK